MKHLLLTTIAAVVLVGTAFADPIHDAARTGDLAGVQAELNKGVDVNAKDGDEWSVLDMATRLGHPELADLLRKHGGKTKKELEADTAIIDLLRKHGSKTSKELKAEGK